MNPNLARLRPCPFEKLRQFVVGVRSKPSLREIRLSIGGPASYPTTPGRPALRRTIADRMEHRYDHASDTETQIIRAGLGKPDCVATDGQPTMLPPSPSTLPPKGEVKFVSRARDFHIELAEAT